MLAVLNCMCCIQALSQRIHYGKFVAEAKYRANEEVYRRQVEQQDAEALMDLLTDVSVEQQVRSVRALLMHRMQRCPQHQAMWSGVPWPP